MTEIKFVGVDLDGVLCKYPEAWINFINRAMDANYVDLNQAKQQVPFSLYHKLKNQYRRSGIKATLQALPYAQEFMQKLRDKGYIVIILTARPIYEYPEVFRDTIIWLKNNKIVYDTIFASKDKHYKIIKYFPSLQFMVEDNAAKSNEIAKLGYKVYLIDSPYNQQPIDDNVIRIKTLDKIEV